MGFYNLFLASGAVIGVLFVSDLLALSRPRGSGIAGSIAQALPPTVAILATVW